MQEYLTPEEARSQGFIPISEAVKIKPQNRSTYSRQAESGAIPSVQVSKGSRPVYWVLASALGKGSTLSGGTYESMRDKWLKGMEIGLYSHKNKPLSKKYVDSVLKWGLHIYWEILGGAPSLSGINAENFVKVITSERLQIDRSKRKDYYSTKMHIYRACTRFTTFLINEGLKSPGDLEALRACLPGQEYDHKRGFVDEAEMQEIIKFNSTWLDGRAQYDADVTDLLLHLYGYAGLRKMEAAWLRLKDIDFKNNLMLVFGKGSKERFVPLILFPELKPKLQNWIDRLRPSSASGLLLVQSDGSPLTESSINDRLQRLGMAMRVAKTHKKLALENPGWSLELIKIEARLLAKKLENPVKAHEFRRGFATILDNKGMPLTMIQEILGHSDIETTRGYVRTNINQIMGWANSNLDVPILANNQTIYTRDALFKSIAR